LRTIYLDNNATTRIAPEVADAMAECYAAGYLNPASQHGEGRRARQRLEEARDGIGRLLGARLDHTPTDRILFTSGGTESNNLAIHGLRRTHAASPSEGKEGSEGKIANELIVSSIEHPSVLAAATALQSRANTDIRLAAVDSQGKIDLNQFQSLLSPQTRAVSIMLGNNETGVLQPLEEIVKLCAEAGAPVHTDAVQAVGKVPVSFADLGVTALTATAHKFHGPRGIGVLLLRHDAKLEPIFHGGSQQLGSRPGTESVALAVGMHKALELCHADQANRQSRMEQLRNQLQATLLAQIPTLIVNSGEAPRLPHTLNVSIPGLDRQPLLLALDQSGLACSTGSACESGSSQPSHVLIAMQAAAEVIEGSIRISLSANTTVAEIEKAAEIFIKTTKRLFALQ